jgi:two-component system cell cycle response regulator
MSSQPSNLRIALVDDDEMYCDYVSLLLAPFGDVQLWTASCEAELFDLLRTETIDCILLDYNLGYEDGISITQKIRSGFPTAPPVVLLTGDVKLKTVIRAFRVGVSDYVVKKDLNASELLRVVRDTVARTERARRHEEDYERLLRQSPFDGSTGLYGRGFIDERAAQMCARQASMGIPFAVVLIEFVEWPKIAARFGAMAGDRALKAFVSRLKDVTRASDTCGRYEDALFVYLVDLGVGLDILAQIEARLVPALSTPIELDEFSLRATARVASALCPQHGRTLDALFAHARMGLTTDGVTPGRSERPAQAPGAAPAGRDFGGAPGLGGAGVVEQVRADSIVLSRSQDRRREHRRKTFKRGTILLDGVGSQIGCTIRDLSQYGAKLMVNDYFMAPDHFTLRIAGLDETHRVRRCWQIGAVVGVEFV